MTNLREQLTYSNVMSTLAVFGVLAGGTALALPGRNSVNSGDIKNRQVRPVDVADLKFKPLPLRNLWTASSMTPPASPPGYAIDGERVVHLRGAIDGSESVDSIAFDLPPSASPPGVVRMPVVDDDVTPALGRINIFSDGAANFAISDDSSISLDGVTFRAR